jgi:hypothetical protein
MRRLVAVLCVVLFGLACDRSDSGGGNRSPAAAEASPPVPSPEAIYTQYATKIRPLTDELLRMHALVIHADSLKGVEFQKQLKEIDFQILKLGSALTEEDKSRESMKKINDAIKQLRIADRCFSRIDQIGAKAESRNAEPTRGTPNLQVGLEALEDLKEVLHAQDALPVAIIRAELQLTRLEEMLQRRE